MVKTGASAVTSATFSGTTQGLQLANTLSVTGATTLGATTVTGNLTISANSTSGNLTVSANTTTSNLSVTGSVLLTAPLPVAQGGTGATTSGAALTSLGAVTTGKSIAMALIFGF